jgi:hypothetical protein
MASFSFGELSASFDACFPGGVTHRCARLMRLYQVHWLEGERSRAALDPRRELGEDRLDAHAKKTYQSLRWLFRSDPLVRGDLPPAPRSEAP